MPRSSISSSNSLGHLHVEQEFKWAFFFLSLSRSPIPRPFVAIKCQIFDECVRAVPLSPAVGSFILMLRQIKLAPRVPKFQASRRISSTVLAYPFSLGPTDEKTQVSATRISACFAGTVTRKARMHWLELSWPPRRISRPLFPFLLRYKMGAPVTP